MDVQDHLEVRRSRLPDQAERLLSGMSHPLWRTIGTPKERR
jgi:hypothetical protein